MKDRAMAYPGRVRLTEVTGQEGVYDMTREDGVTQEGTPLNKAHLLTDATAQKIGFDPSVDDPSVDDALNKLADLAVVSGSYTGTGRTAATADVWTEITVGAIQPQLLFVAKRNDGQQKSSTFVASGVLPCYGTFYRENELEAANGKVRWHFGTSGGGYEQDAALQFNTSGAVYDWLVIGSRE